MCARAVIKQRWSLGWCVAGIRIENALPTDLRSDKSVTAPTCLKSLPGHLFFFLTHVQSSWVILAPLVSERFCTVV